MGASATQRRIFARYGLATRQRQSANALASAAYFGACHKFEKDDALGSTSAHIAAHYFCPIDEWRASIVHSRLSYKPTDARPLQPESPLIANVIHVAQFTTHHTEQIVRKFASMSAGLLMLVSSALNAQRLEDVRTGTMVRVTTCRQDAFAGPLLDARADTVRITTLGNQPPVVIPSSTICAYALGGGRDRARGAWNGLVLGGGIGLVVLAVMKTAVQGGIGDEVKFGQRFAIASTLFGLGIGTVIAPERWIPPRK